MIRLAIVEDEDIYAEKLTEYLEKYQKETGKSFRIDRYTDGAELVENYRGDYDIILMDIQMKLMDGMSAAEEIRALDRQVVILFITNMTQYAIRGYQVDALDYMVKPVEYFSFSRKMDRAVSRIKREEHHWLSIPLREGMQKIDLNDIYYVESRAHSMVYHTEDREYASRGTMKELEKMFVPYDFFRIGNSFLVNMKYVDGVQSNCCVIRGESLPVSRGKRKEFMDALLEHMSEVIR